MQYNSEANSDDLVSDAKFWCGIDSSDTTTYAAADMARNANRGLDSVVSLIFKSDNGWDWDDTNYADLPMGTTTLVDGQSDYSIPVTHLRILKLRVKDSTGTYKTIEPATMKTLPDDILTATAGMPRYYVKVANSIFLYPKPSTSFVTATAGLEVQFQRGGSYFVVGDTTKTPGFASQFHRLISLHMALDYCDINDLDKRAAKIRNAITKMENELVEFYSDRARDEQTSIRLKREDYGQGALGSNTFGRSQNGFNV